MPHAHGIVVQPERWKERRSGTVEFVSFESVRRRTVKSAVRLVRFGLVAQTHWVVGIASDGHSSLPTVA